MMITLGFSLHQHDDHVDWPEELRHMDSFFNFRFDDALVLLRDLHMTHEHGCTSRGKSYRRSATQ